MKFVDDDDDDLYVRPYIHILSNWMWWNLLREWMFISSDSTGPGTLRSNIASVWSRNIFWPLSVHV